LRRRWRPTEVLLSRRPPQDPARYQKHFRAPLRFNTDQNAVVFPSRWLAHPLPGADTLLHRHLQQQATDLHTRQRKSLVSDLRRLLRKSLRNQHGTASVIAGQLGMHERTLHRHLRAEGTNFREILEEVRYDLARQLLTDSSMPLPDIAAALDYADATAFSRAFKRWSGLAPNQAATASISSLLSLSAIVFISRCGSPPRLPCCQASS